ncbi:DHA2 family efflux MFS transporter permease subunit [Corynebacterium amycolatum]|uniref:DHA2 family efflux MFS transporter permease subunit n=1 Tax=Corynebacterium amycolatum TaxID=43765 RepID=UPI000185C2FB|nr:DHA2 family efflux MFS transporter permease subunit [Corynebacterium amycolatum]EEB62357.1 drug resistance MFS transporter, drug:H+ antiporter-2 family [Corynebacterium amycolatum SK46]
MATDLNTQFDPKKAWPALWTVLLGFFMILVDATIVTVGINTIQHELGGELNQVMWVTSGYLLAYAVPLLITGRLGDLWGVKHTYVAGLVIFVLASLACGLAPSLSMLIIARVVQGLGAALLTPQTMALITQMFPPAHRGAAMGLWGAAAGIASLTGPLAGGILIQLLSWRWIFLINVPIGLVGLVFAFRYLPAFETHRNKIDYLGVVLSAIGMFLLVFGIQEGESAGWAGWIWALIVAGAVVLGLFTVWESKTMAEPLMPLLLFKDRNFTISSLAIAVMGALVVAVGFPIILFAQNARDLSTIQASLLLVPQALISGVMAPWTGRMLDRLKFREFALIGFGSSLVGMLGFHYLIHEDLSVLWLLLPGAAFGVANAFIWGTLSTAATRNIDPTLAGAASGVYNTIRQIGSVLGSALIATVMAAALSSNHGDFTTAMSDAMWLPVALSALGVVAALGLKNPK